MSRSTPNNEAQTRVQTRQSYSERVRDDPRPYRIQQSDPATTATHRDALKPAVPHATQYGYHDPTGIYHAAPPPYIQ